MYNIFTSYFSNPKFNKRKDSFFIPICSTIPNNVLFYTHYKEVAPDLTEVVKLKNQKTITEESKSVFIEKYIQKLDILRENKTLDKYVKDLEDRVKYADVYLLCYERPVEFYHRHILAKYLNKYYKLGIEEY